MNNFLIGFFAFFLVFAALIVQAEDSPEFKVDRGLLDSLYKESVTEIATETRMRPGGSIEISPILSLSTPSDFSLSNDYFTVPYNQNGATFPLLQFFLSTPMFNWGDIKGYGQFRVGFSFREAIYEVQSKSGAANLRDLVRLQWIPLSVGPRFSYSIPGFSAITPYLSLGAGAQWLRQDGKLDGISQGFWIPFYLVSGGVTLFGSPTSGSWFGGVHLGATISRSFSSSQKLQHWTADIGTSLVL